MQEKPCSKCKRSLPLTEFHQRRVHNNKIGYHSHCKSCRNLYEKHNCNPDDPNYYENLLIQANSRCQICGTEKFTRANRNKNRFTVDHNHTTGKIRGLLCSECNSGLGMFQDNPSILFAAYRYLMDSDYSEERPV